MKSKKITVKIKAPVSEVFAFTLNPRDTTGNWSEYIVTDAKNKSFVMSKKDGNYHVKYTFESSSNGTKLTYFEWVDSGDLRDPFTPEILEKLKAVIESNSK